MALYEYRCRTCDDVFEVRRPMSEAAAPTACPQGHGDTVKLLSMFARTPALATGGGSGGGGAGGGCCGGGCGCAR